MRAFCKVNYASGKKMLVAWEVGVCSICGFCYHNFFQTIVHHRQQDSGLVIMQYNVCGHANFDLLLLVQKTHEEIGRDVLIRLNKANISWNLIRSKLDESFTEFGHTHKFGFRTKYLGSLYSPPHKKNTTRKIKTDFLPTLRFLGPDLR